MTQTRASSPGSSTDSEFEILGTPTRSVSDDGWSVMHPSRRQPEYFFIGSGDSPRGLDQSSDRKEAIAEMSASGTASDADMAISMILRDSDRQAVQQHVELIRSEAQVTATKLKAVESELAARAAEIFQLEAEVAQQREKNAEFLQMAEQQNQASQAAPERFDVEDLQEKVSVKKKLIARGKEVLQLRKEFAEFRGVHDQFRAEVAKELAQHQEEARVAIKQAEEEAAKHQEEAKLAIQRAQEESARAAEAESLMVAMNVEAESLTKDLATAADENAALRHNLSATTTVDHNWSLKDLEGVWMSEPKQEIQWLDGASGGIWSKDGQWAKVVEYAGGFALLPTGKSTCRGEVLHSARGWVLLWPGHGAWVKKSESAVCDAWEVGSLQLRCPSNHCLRWAPISSAHASKHLSSSSKSCKRWDVATQLLSACSACSFPVASTEAGMWQCRGCRYNVCGSCAAASAPLNRETHDVRPFEVLPGQEFTCNGCSSVCGSGKAVVGHHVENVDHYLCLSCVSTFLTQA